MPEVIAHISLAIAFVCIVLSLIVNLDTLRIMRKTDAILKRLEEDDG